MRNKKKIGAAVGAGLTLIVAGKAVTENQKITTEDTDAPHSTETAHEESKKLAIQNLQHIFHDQLLSTEKTWPSSPEISDDEVINTTLQELLENLQRSLPEHQGYYFDVRYPSKDSYLEFEKDLYRDGIRMYMLGQKYQLGEVPSLKVMISVEPKNGTISIQNTEWTYGIDNIEPYQIPDIIKKLEEMNQKLSDELARQRAAYEANRERLEKDAENNYEERVKAVEQSEKDRYDAQISASRDFEIFLKSLGATFHGRLD